MVIVQFRLKFILLKTNIKGVFQNFVDEVSKLAKYLQCEKDEVFYRDIEQACSFDNMKQNKKDDTAQFDKHRRSTTYRTGEKIWYYMKTNERLMEE